MEDDGLVQKILSAHPGKFGRVLRNASQYRFQVLLSQVERSPSGERRLVRHGYRVDAEYFYPARESANELAYMKMGAPMYRAANPASNHFMLHGTMPLTLSDANTLSSSAVRLLLRAIKLGAVVAAAEKLERFHLPEDQKFHLATPLCFFPLFEGGEEKRIDPTNLNKQKITLAHEIRKLFLVSDNEAFNRLYAIVGHRTLNEIMWDKGLKSARFHHRLSVLLSASLNHCCEPVEVHVDGISYVLAPKKSELCLPDNRSIPGVLVGKAYVAANGELIGEPMDFSLKNYISLLDLQDLLVKLVRPDVELGTPALQVGGDVRMVLLEAMSQYPASSCNPFYDGAEYPDDYCKFFLPGVARVRSKGAVRIYNKIGRAYGFTIDNAYVLDAETGKSFFLSAVIYTNRNGIVNDDNYEYEDVADKVMADLGEVIANALWEVPPTAINGSSAFDQTPSSLWNLLNRPIVPESPYLGFSEQSSLQPPLLSENREQVQMSDNDKDAVVSEELEIKMEQQTVISPAGPEKIQSERKVRSCYQYFIDE